MIILEAIQKDKIVEFISSDVTTPIYLIKNFNQAGFVFSASYIQIDIDQRAFKSIYEATVPSGRTIFK